MPHIPARPTEEFLALLGASAALDGRPRVGPALAGLAAGSVALLCPGCDAALAADVDGDGLTVTEFDGHRRPAPWAGPPHRADTDPSAPDLDDLPWLLRQCRADGQDQVATWITALFAQTTCPVCQALFPPVDHLMP